MSAEDEAKLREMTHALERRDEWKQWCWRGTNLNLVFNATNAGFRAAAMSTPSRLGRNHPHWPVSVVRAGSWPPLI